MIHKVVISDKFMDFISKFNGEVDAITLPFLIVCRKEFANDKYLLNHEKIHLCQYAELLIIGFPIVYFISYFINRLSGSNSRSSYFDIILEREAYANQYDLDYIKNRKPFSWIGY